MSAKRKRWFLLTLDQEISGAGGPATAAAGGHRVGPRVLGEGLSDQQAVQVALLQDPEVSGALDLCSLPVELDQWSGDPCDPDVQPHLAPLAHCGTLQPLDKARGRCLCCWTGRSKCYNYRKWVWPGTSWRLPGALTCDQELGGAGGLSSSVGGPHRIPSTVGDAHRRDLQNSAAVAERDLDAGESSSTKNLAIAEPAHLRNWRTCRGTKAPISSADKTKACVGSNPDPDPLWRTEGCH